MMLLRAWYRLARFLWRVLTDPDLMDRVMIGAQFCPQDLTDQMAELTDRLGKEYERRIWTDTPIEMLFMDRNMTRVIGSKLEASHRRTVQEWHEGKVYVASHQDNQKRWIYREL